MNAVGVQIKYKWNVDKMRPQGGRPWKSVASACVRLSLSAERRVITPCAEREPAASRVSNVHMGPAASPLSSGSSDQGGTFHYSSLKAYCRSQHSLMAAGSHAETSQWARLIQICRWLWMRWCKPVVMQREWKTRAMGLKWVWALWAEEGGGGVQWCVAVTKSPKGKTTSHLDPADWLSDWLYHR